MRSKLSFRILLIAGLFGALFSLACGGGGGGLTLGKIQGPSSLNERASAVFSIVVTGDTGITYQWAVKPASAGIFTNGTTASGCTFQASDVTADTPVKIMVTVNSDNFGSEVCSLNVTIKESIPAAGWAQSWGGSYYDYGDDVAVDSSASVFVTGRFSSTVDFDPGSGVDNHTSNGKDAVFLSKFDSSGDFLWAKTWGGSGSAVGSAVAVDNSGNVYVTGYFSGTVDFDPGSGVDNHSGGGAFLSKFDSSGDFIWAKTWSASGKGVVVDSSGNVYVTGLFGTSVDFDPGPGVESHTSNGDYDVFLSKFDSSGDFLWAKTWGGNYKDCSYGVAGDGTGSVFVTGSIGSTADFDPGSGVDNHSGGAFLSKFDSSGNFIWAKTWGGSGGENANGVATDSTGSAYVTGYFSGTVDFDPGSGADNHTSNGESDAFLCKFDSSGNSLWAETWGGIGWDTASGISVDSSGSLYVTGDFYGTVDFDPGSGVDNQTIRGESGAFLSKFGSSGNFLWAETWGGLIGCVRGFSVVVDSSGSVYVTGGLWDTSVDFDPGSGVDIHVGSGTFLSKFKPDGSW
jgi:hypothetical protein